MLVRQVLSGNLVNAEKVHVYTILNNTIGFNRLLGDLKTVHNPEIIFEATGVYYRRLQAFLEDSHTAKFSGSQEAIEQSASS